MIRIARDVHEAMIAHALEERPFECCGLLAGSGGTITSSHRATNVAELCGIRYQIDPGEIYRINRAVDDADLDLLGGYHSHPFTRAYPSPTDVAAAASEFVYVIVSLTDFLAPVVKAFTIANGQVAEQPVEIV